LYSRSGLLLLLGERNQKLAKLLDVPTGSKREDVHLISRSSMTPGNPIRLGDALAASLPVGSSTSIGDSELMLVARLVTT
jgi:hypothetical protein